jgi:hypothetical protein
MVVDTSGTDPPPPSLLRAYVKKPPNVEGPADAGAGVMAGPTALIVEPVGLERPDADKVVAGVCAEATGTDRTELGLDVSISKSQSSLQESAENCDEDKCKKKEKFGVVAQKNLGKNPERQNCSVV